MSERPPQCRPLRGALAAGAAGRRFTLSRQNQVFTTAVISPSDVWAFGTKPGSGSGLGYGPPWAIRYNGHSWQSVSMPGVATSVSTVSASDIWALGPSAATAGNDGAEQVPLAMHWNGKSWRSLTLPAPAPVNGFAWHADSIVALSASDVWAAGC
jgi:hypothetical protein